MRTGLCLVTRWALAICFVACQCATILCGKIIWPEHESAVLSGVNTAVFQVSSSDHVEAGDCVVWSIDDGQNEEEAGDTGQRHTNVVCSPPFVAQLNFKFGFYEISAALISSSGSIKQSHNISIFAEPTLGERGEHSPECGSFKILPRDSSTQLPAFHHDTLAALKASPTTRSVLIIENSSSPTLVVEELLAAKIKGCEPVVVQLSSFACSTCGLSPAGPQQAGLGAYSHFYGVTTLNMGCAHPICTWSIPLEVPPSAVAMAGAWSHQRKRVDRVAVFQGTPGPEEENTWLALDKQAIDDLREELQDDSEVVMFSVERFPLPSDTTYEDTFEPASEYPLCYVPFLKFLPSMPILIAKGCVPVVAHTDAIASLVFPYVRELDLVMPGSTGSVATCLQKLPSLATCDQFEPGGTIACLLRQRDAFLSAYSNWHSEAWARLQAFLSKSGFGLAPPSIEHHQGAADTEETQPAQVPPLYQAGNNEVEAPDSTQMKDLISVGQGLGTAQLTGSSGIVRIIEPLPGRCHTEDELVINVEIESAPPGVYVLVIVNGQQVKPNGTPRQSIRLQQLPNGHHRAEAHAVDKRGRVLATAISPFQVAPVCIQSPLIGEGALFSVDGHNKAFVSLFNRDSSLKAEVDGEVVFQVDSVDEFMPKNRTLLPALEACLPIVESLGLGRLELLQCASIADNIPSLMTKSPQPLSRVWAVVSCDDSFSYALSLLPVVRAWQIRVRADVLVVLVGDSWKDPVPWQSLLISELKQLGANVILTAGAGLSKATFSQVARVFASQLEMIGPDDIVVPSDADIFPLKGDVYRSSLDGDRHIGLINAFCCEAWKREETTGMISNRAPTWRMGDGVADDDRVLHTAVVNVIARKSTWRKMLDGVEGCDCSAFHGQEASVQELESAVQACMLNRLGENRARQQLNSPHDDLDQWYMDQQILSEAVDGYEFWPNQAGFINRQTGGDRLDRSAWARLSHSKQLQRFVDAHLPRDLQTDSGWKAMLPLLELALGKWHASDQTRLRDLLVQSFHAT